MNLPTTVSLSECATNRVVFGAVDSLSLSYASNNFNWWGTTDKEKEAEEKDRPWDWTAFASSTVSDAMTFGRVIVTPQEGVQGAIWLGIEKSVVSPDLLSVHIHRLATAPWNRSRLTATPKYKGVGTALVLYAVCYSYTMSLGGRVNLSTLPTPETVKFYEGIGFTNTGEEDKEGLAIFEMGADVAQNWLKKRRFLQ